MFSIHKDTSIWRLLVNIWTIALYVAIIADFFTINGLGSIIPILTSVYSGTLAIYAADKEFERWHDSHRERHPGEMYVAFWTILVVGLLVGQVIMKSDYHIPAEVVSTYIVVLGTLAISRKSRSLYHTKKNKVHR